jgi:TPR repeat protein
MVGTCYQLGLGIPVNPSAAVIWYERAIANGSGLAANNLAMVVVQGYDAVLPDRHKANQLLQQARELGFEHAPHADWF